MICSLGSFLISTLPSLLLECFSLWTIVFAFFKAGSESKPDDDFLLNLRSMFGMFDYKKAIKLKMNVNEDIVPN